MSNTSNQIDLLHQVRTGRVQFIAATSIRSGIDKAVREGRVMIGPTGVEGDEQGEAIIHGGPEKAVLHYAARHYDAWRAEFPASQARLQPGGFGENLVSFGLDETQVCIGDAFRIGGAVLQVAQPRQPCFKLNHRFGHAGMSVRAQESGRTGWYYRVLEPGGVAAGDPVELLDRPAPGWQVRSVQHVLYADPLNRAALEVLASHPLLAEAIRRVFAKRLATGLVESWTQRLIHPTQVLTPP